MAGSVETPVDEQLKQLNNARKLVLGDTSYYPQIVQSVLPILQPGHQLPIRRWGADFLAEVFSSPALKISQKETICLLVLETLKNLIQDPNEDAYVLRNAIQTCASVYPLAFNWVLTNSYDSPTWERVMAIKSRILQIWDGAPPPIRICCIKFAQRVVLAQTVASSDRQRGDLNINLAMIPQNHPFLDPRHLEAEATGLLDRMLVVLQENSSDAIVVDATLNSLSILVRTRPGTSNRIMTAVLNFNPLKLANSPMTPKTKVLIKSMEKTTRMLLMHLVKRDPHNPNTPRLQQHAERLMRSRAEILDEGSRKRAHVDANGQDAGKRQKLIAGPQTEAPAAPSTPALEITALEPGSHSLAELFTLSKDKGLASFDATHVPLPYAVKITVAALARTEPGLFAKALDGVRGRLEEMAKAETEINPETAPLGVDDDDDDYEPDFDDTGEDTEQILNKLDSAPPEAMDSKPLSTSLALGSVSLPPAPVLNPEMAAKVGRGTVARVFSTMRMLEESTTKKSKLGLSRLAASSLNQESWVTVIARLATRSSAGLEDVPVKPEDGLNNGNNSRPGPSLNDSIRELLYTYVMEDFRRRIEVAAYWLCEEWYCDQVTKKHGDGNRGPLHYDKWVIKVMDGFISYLNPQDKVFTRFLSEMPELNKDILSRVKRLCRDPAMVQLVTTSLYYLVMLRPPVRNMVLDTFQEIWVEFEDARPFAEKYLAKWRPDFVKAVKAAQQQPMVAVAAN